MAIPDTETKKEGEEKSSTVTVGSSAATSAVCQVPEPTKRYYIEDFSVPEGFSDGDIFIFLVCCKAHIDDLKNYEDKNNKFYNIAISGAKGAENPEMFTLNLCIELAESLKKYVQKHKISANSHKGIKQLYEDSVDVLPYFPDCDANICSYRARNKSSDTNIHTIAYRPTDNVLSYVALEKLIIQLGYEYAKFFGFPKTSPAYIFREMSKKVARKLGIKCNVQKHLEGVKKNITSEVLQEQDVMLRQKKFLSLAKHYLSYFNYINPRSTKVTDFYINHENDASSSSAAEEIDDNESQHTENGEINSDSDFCVKASVETIISEVVNNEKKRVKLAKEMVKPNEEHVKSSKEMVKPEETVKSSKEIVKPEETVKSSKEIVKPNERHVKPEETVKSSKEIVKPNERHVKSEETVKSSKEIVKPNERHVKPEETVKSSKEIVKSNEGIVKPEETVKSSKETVKPSEEIVKSSEEIVTPSKEQVKPSEEIVTPSKEQVKPSEESVTFSKENIKPPEEESVKSEGIVREQVIPLNNNAPIPVKARRGRGRPRKHRKMKLSSITNNAETNLSHLRNDTQSESSDQTQTTMSSSSDIDSAITLNLDPLHEEAVGVCESPKESDSNSKKVPKRKQRKMYSPSPTRYLPKRRARESSVLYHPRTPSPTKRDKTPDDTLKREPEIEMSTPTLPKRLRSRSESKDDDKSKPSDNNGEPRNKKGKSPAPPLKTRKRQPAKKINSQISNLSTTKASSTIMTKKTNESSVRITRKMSCDLLLNSNSTIKSPMKDNLHKDWKKNAKHAFVRVEDVTLSPHFSQPLSAVGIVQKQRRTPPRIDVSPPIRLSRTKKMRDTPLLKKGFKTLNDAVHEQVLTPVRPKTEKKVDIKLKPDKLRVRTKLLEHGATLPKDVENVYNPSSDSARIVRQRVLPVNSATNDPMLGGTSTINSALEDLVQLDVNSLPFQRQYRRPQFSETPSRHSEMQSSLMQLMPANATHNSQSSLYGPSPYVTFTESGTGSAPPKWFENFVLDHKRRESCRIKQLMHMQDEIVQIETQKIAVLQNILTTLNKLDKL